MSQTAIRIEGLGKRYRIGGKLRYYTLRDTLANLFRRPFFTKPLTFDGGGVDGGRSKDDDYIWALKDISFEINQGEVVGIIGANGAGKSTLLKILCRITEPTKGYAEIYGRVSALLEVGTGFHPELNGRENVYLNGSILGMQKWEIDKKFEEIVDFSGVEKFIDTPLKHYSSGMQVRLAFAVAAHLESEIILVDEVLAVGDAAFQKKCLGKMDDVAKQGRTVLFVSHNMFSLQNLCHQGILLKGGKVSFRGAINETIDKYLNPGDERFKELVWDSPKEAPGDHRVRLKAIRIVSNGCAKREVEISKEFRIEVDYWNLQPDSQRLVSVHIYNSTGTCVLTSANFPSVCLTPDPWYAKPYPSGLFRTSCTIPGNLLNNGSHLITIYICERMYDIIVSYQDIPFTVIDDETMRQEYSGPWLGAVRPRLAWETQPL